MLFVLLAFIASQSQHEEALRLYQEGKLADAARVLESLLVERPDDGRARFQLGAVYLRLGRVDQARTLFSELVADYPDVADLAYQIGAIYFLAGELDEGRKMLEHALALEPDHIDAQVTLGQLEGRARHFDRALAILEDVSRRAPRLPAPYYYRGAIHDLRDEPAKAIEALEAGREINPQDPRFDRLLGAVYLKLEQWPAAEGALKTALRSGAEGSDVYFDLGRAHLGQEELLPAREAFEKASGAEALLQLGYIAWRLSDYEKAVELLETCIAQEPGLMRAHHFLGLIALRKGDLDGAEKYFTAALERDPNFAEAHFNLGKIFLRRREPGAAVDHLEKALEIRDDYKEVYYQLGFAYRRLGEKELAARALARFQELSQAPP